MDNTSDLASEREDDSGIESAAPEPIDTTVYIRISVPEIKVQKCLQFQQEDTVWSVKQRVLATLAKDVRDGLNYGLYCPPMNGRAGKFLEEERPLKDYPMQGPIGFLEFKYKRRVYKLMNINPRKLRQLHTKANLKQFMEYVKTKNIEKITKMTNKGLDPNFHDHDSGSTPLGVAATLDRPRNVMLSLVSGGAHLDFRAKDGTTPMHRASAKGNQEALKTLLELGASSNYKDNKGLTPLYHAVCNDNSAFIVEMLLHDHARVGTQDERGWTEVHQACKRGRVQHLEHLLFYGANMNLQNSSGNTPLHVSAVNNQDSCARVLLFRGADKTIQNFANQDAFQVAVIAGNTELAEVIRNHSSDDVVPFQEVPKFNEKRRPAAPGFRAALQRSRSDPRLNISFQEETKMISGSLNRFPSNGHLFGQANSDLLYQERTYDSDSPRSMSISSAGSGRGSICSEKLLYSYPKKRLYPAMPGRMFMCVKSHKPEDEAELALQKVLSVGEQGYWEGKANNREGWFPSCCVEEVQMRRKGPRSSHSDEDTVIVKRQTLAALTRTEGENAPRTVVLQKGKNGFGFVLRGAKSQSQTGATLEFTPTQDFPALQYLDRVDRGSMADKAGLKPGDFLLEINSENVVNATHEHTVNLIKGSGDTLAMKVITVQPLSKDGLEQDAHMDGTMTLPSKRKMVPAPPRRAPHTSLSASRGKAKSMSDGLQELEKLDKTLAEYSSGEVFSPSTDNFQLYSMSLPRGVSKKIDTENKTASIRSRHSARITAVQLEDIFARQGEPEVHVQENTSGGKKPTVPLVPKTFASPSDMKARLNGRIPDGNLERARSSPNLAHRETVHITNVYQDQEEIYSHHISPNTSQKGNTFNNNKYERQTSAPIRNEINTEKVPNGDSTREHLYAVPMKGPRPRHGSVGDSSNSSSDSGIVGGINALHISSDRTAIPPRPQGPPPSPPQKGNTVIPAPPNHPPPTPPKEVGEVIRISTQTPPTYANISEQIMQQKAIEASAIESSFRPGTHAKLNKQPMPTPKGTPNHSRNPSLSSIPEHKERKLSVHRTVEQFEHHANGVARRGSSGSEKSAVTFADDKIYENAAKYIRDHPNATLLVTADVGSRQDVQSGNTKQGTTSGQTVKKDLPYYEPEPDYDVAAEVTKVAPADGHRSALMQEIRLQKTVRKEEVVRAEKTAATAQQERASPKVDEPSTSEFSNAIAMAALAREKRQQQREIQEKEADKVKQVKPKTPTSKANAPPPPASSPVTSKPAMKPSPRSSSLPPHLQKQLEAERQAEESRAALMAAVARRRNKVDNADPGDEANSIESRIQRSRQLQSAVYAKEPVQVEKAKATPTPPPQKTTPPTPPLQKVQSPQTVVKRTDGAFVNPARAEVKEEIKLAQVAYQKPQDKREENSLDMSVKSSPQNIMFTTPGNSDSSGENSPSRELGPSNFKERAEKARLEWIKKRGGTLDRKDKKEVGQDNSTKTVQAEPMALARPLVSPKSVPAEPNKVMELRKQSEPRPVKKAAPKPPEAENNKTVAPPPPPPPVEQISPVKTVKRDPTPTRNNIQKDPSPDKQTGLGDLASIVAARALQRQKTTEGTVDDQLAQQRSGERRAFSAVQPSKDNIVYRSKPVNQSPAQKDVLVIDKNKQSKQNTSSKQATPDTTSQKEDVQSPVRARVMNFEKMGDPSSGDKQNRLQKNISVELKDATVDHSNTDISNNTPKLVHQNKIGTSNNQALSVAARAKMFQSSSTPGGAKSPGTAKSTLPFELPPPMYESNRNSVGDGLPPMVPPPPDFDADKMVHSENVNDPTFSWILSSIPPKGIKSDASYINGHLSDIPPPPGLEDPIQGMVVPPPPVFESIENVHLKSQLEDAASLVSSVSSLSTLSSERGDSLQESPRHSYMKQYDIGQRRLSTGMSYDVAVPPPPESSGPFEDIPAIAPPPPGFDDFNGSNGDSGGDDMPSFIPPPMEFGTTSSAPIPAVTSLRSTMKAASNSVSYPAVQQSHGTKPFQNKPIDTWSQSDVSDWLDSLQLGEHKRSFAQRNITGRTLVKMGRNELISLGVSQVGHRMHLERSIKKAVLNK